MKKVHSIFGIFAVFLLMILASFFLLSWQSTMDLRSSLIQTAQLQTKYATTLLEQKGKEIEIEADGQKEPCEETADSIPMIAY